MKKIPFLSMVAALVLAVAAVGCTTAREGYGDDGYYESQPAAQNRVYVNDPYRGTVVLERDPYTGRYYEVNTYGSSGYRSYGARPNYRSYPRYNRTYRTNPPVQQHQQPTREQIEKRQEVKKEARDKVLGG